VQVLRPAAAAGDVDALIELTIMLEEHGRIAESEQILEHVSVTYDQGTGWLATLLEKQGRPRQAEAVLLRSVAGGSREAFFSRSRLVKLFVAQDRFDEAEALLRDAVTPGSLGATEDLVEFLEARGRAAECEELWWRLAEHGDASARWYACHHLARSLTESGRAAEVEPLWRRNLAAGGGQQVLELLADLLDARGRADEAARLRANGLNPDGSVAGG
jgi:hypothetical protein